MPTEDDDEVGQPNAIKEMVSEATYQAGLVAGVGQVAAAAAIHRLIGQVYADTEEMWNFMLHVEDFLDSVKGSGAEHHEGDMHEIRATIRAWKERRIDSL